MTDQLSREAALAAPIAELLDILHSWRAETDYALEYLGGLEDYPAGARAVAALRAVQAALAELDGPAVVEA